MHEQHTAPRCVDIKHSLLLLGTFIGGLYFASNNPMPGTEDEEVYEIVNQNKGHQCNWEDCELVGSEEFHHEECEQGTDCYLFHLTHFMHPKWSYERCEDYLFSHNDQQPETITSTPL